MMLVQAAADGWKVPPAECGVSESVITHKASGRTTTYGKVAAEAAKLKPPENVALKDPKDWKIAGKRLARLDTVDKVTGAQIYGMDLKLPGMLNAAIKDCPVFGGKVKSADATAVLQAQRREKGRARRRFGGRGGRRHVVACEDRARRAADRVGLRPECERIECELRAGAEGRARREGRGGRELGGRRRGGARRRAAQDRGGLFVSASEPRDDGSDERHRALDIGALRGLDADAERRGRTRCGLGSRRVCRSRNARSTRRCWAAASAAAAQPTGSARPSRSRRKCRARR